LGMANICGSFFQCFTSCGALGRTALADSSGGKTQLVTVISSSIVVLVLLFLSPFLQSLPNACLGSIIIVALLGNYSNLKLAVVFMR
jgi:MFS superfamily sulfate permease-like transporter